jgi:hypothetical protein
MQSSGESRREDAEACLSAVIASAYAQVRFASTTSWRATMAGRRCGKTAVAEHP